MNVKDLKTKDHVNVKINEILRNNNITPDQGQEGFWNAVEDLESTNPEDGALLRELGNHWETVPFMS
jgi:hypothetical protein